MAEDDLPSGNPDDHVPSVVGQTRAVTRAMYRALQGRKLAAALRDAALTQVALSSKTRIPQSHISAIIHGRLGMSPQKAGKIAAALRIPAAQLMVTEEEAREFERQQVEAADLVAREPETVVYGPGGDEVFSPIDPAAPAMAGAYMPLQVFLAKHIVKLSPEEVLGLRTLTWSAPVGVISDEIYWRDALDFLRKTLTRQVPERR